MKASEIKFTATKEYPVCQGRRETSSTTGTVCHECLGKGYIEYDISLAEIIDISEKYKRGGIL